MKAIILPFALLCLLATPTSAGSDDFQCGKVNVRVWGKAIGYIISIEDEVISPDGVIRFTYKAKDGKSYLNGKPCKYLNDERK
jgi:hypothetical protein